MTLSGNKNKISENTNSTAVLEQTESNIGESKSEESTNRTIKVDRGPETKKQESDGEEQKLEAKTDCETEKRLREMDKSELIGPNLDSETDIHEKPNRNSLALVLGRQISDGAETYHSARASVSGSDLSSNEEDFEDCNDSPEGASVDSAHPQPRSLFVYG